MAEAPELACACSALFGGAAAASYPFKWLRTSQPGSGGTGFHVDNVYMNREHMLLPPPVRKLAEASSRQGIAAAPCSSRPVVCSVPAPVCFVPLQFLPLLRCTSACPLCRRVSEANNGLDPAARHALRRRRALRARGQPPPAWLRALPDHL